MLSEILQRDNLNQNTLSELFQDNFNFLVICIEVIVF